MESTAIFYKVEGLRIHLTTYEHGQIFEQKIPYSPSLVHTRGLSILSEFTPKGFLQIKACILGNTTVLPLWSIFIPSAKKLLELCSFYSFVWIFSKIIRNKMRLVLVIFFQPKHSINKNRVLLYRQADRKWTLSICSNQISYDRSRWNRLTLK